MSELLRPNEVVDGPRKSLQVKQAAGSSGSQRPPPPPAFFHAFTLEGKSETWRYPDFLVVTFVCVHVCVCACMHVCVCVLWTAFFCIFKNVRMDVPGGPMVRNPPASAQDKGSISFGEDSTCQGQLSPGNMTTESMGQKCWSLHALEPMLHNKGVPPLTKTRESPQAATKAQCNQK